MGEIRILHYLNQFFAGVGAEDRADVPPGFRYEPVGPGKRLQTLFGDSARIVVTAYCGDNYFAENTDEVLKKILEVVKKQEVEMIVAGPAIAAGRFGFACMEVCNFLSASEDLYCVTGMYSENPGADSYREYKNRKIFLMPTTDNIKDMGDALSRMAQMVLKLATGSEIGAASEEGYLPWGIRVDLEASKSGADRAVDMLLDKLSGNPFETEISMEIPEETPAAPRITNMKDACIAIISTAGVHPEGNPHGFKVYRNTQYQKYDTQKLNSMKDSSWEVVHGGYNAMFMNENPNFGVPLDACRELEKEGAFAKLYPYFYGTTGVEGLSTIMQELGRDIVADMKSEKVDAALLVST